MKTGLPGLFGVVSYLDALEELKVPAEGRALAALGPRVLRLAANRTAGAHPYLGLANYLSNLRRLGWTDADFAGGGSDALNAGADHVAVQALESDPLPALRALAGALRL